jgi:hypothetical protein
MRYAAKMGSVAVVFIPSLIKIGPVLQKLMEVRKFTVA